MVYSSISLQSNGKDPEDDLIKKIANVVPILNGKDSAGQVIYLGSLESLDICWFFWLPNPNECLV
jgi:hypothetical protein